MDLCCSNSAKFGMNRSLLIDTKNQFEWRFHDFCFQCRALTLNFFNLVSFLPFQLASSSLSVTKLIWITLPLLNLCQILMGKSICRKQYQLVNLMKFRMLCQFFGPWSQKRNRIHDFGPVRCKMDLNAIMNYFRYSDLEHNFFKNLW